MTDWIEHLKNSKLAYWAVGYAGSGGLILGWLQPIIEWFGGGPVTGQVVTVLLVAGFPVTMILVWYHGEKGHQAPTGTEVAWLSLIAVMTGITLFAVISRAGPTPGPIASSVTDSPRIAVLIEDRSADDHLTSMANGVMERLIQELGRSAAFDVLSASQSRPFLGVSAGADSLGRALGVRGLVMGSLVGTDEDLALNLEFVDPATGVARETHTIGPTVIGDEFDTQRRLAEQAASIVRNGLGLEMVLTPPPREGVGSEAWELYWEARRAFHDFLPLFEAGDRNVALSTLERTDQIVDRAIEADRRWATPRVLKVELTFRRGWVAGVYGDRDEARLRFEEGLSLVDGLLRRWPDHPNALTARARTLLNAYIFDVPVGGARREELLAGAYDGVQAAIEHAPNNAEARHLLGEVLTIRGEAVRAQVELEKARESDPYLTSTNQRTVFRLFEAAFDRGRDEEAESWCALGNSLYPDDWLFPYCALQLRAWTGVDVRTEPSQALVDTILARYPTQFIQSFRPVLELTHAAALARAGRPVDAYTLLDRYLGESDGMWTPWTAGVQAILGETDSALAAIEEFASTRPAIWRDFPGARSVLRPLIGMPRFDALLSHQAN